MSDQSHPPDLPEYRDYFGEALAEHHAGPVKKSRFMIGVTVFASIYIVALVIIAAWPYVAPRDLLYAYLSMSTILLSPFIGTAVFIVGFLRRYRYVLGRTVERSGIAIFILGAIAAALLFANPVTA